MKTTSLHLPSNDTATGCLSSILRRLLCDSLWSTSHGDEECTGASVAVAAKTEQKKPATPGIVARLMGLESMPVYPYPSPDLIRRSRSTSSLESWPVFITGPRSRGSPQIKTSTSFREVPTFMRQENDDFLLLSFTHEDEGEIFAMAPKGAQHSIGSRESKEKKCEERGNAFTEGRAEKRIEERKMKKRNEPRNFLRENMSEKKCTTVKDSTSNKKKKNVDRKFGAGTRADGAVKQRERPGRSESVKNRRPTVEVECSSENWSPDSVLDNPFDMAGEHLISITSPVSDEGKQKWKNPRKNLPPEIEILNCSAPSANLSAITRDGRPRRSFHRQRTKSRKSEEHISPDVWGDVCRLAGEDVKTTVWIPKEMWRSEEARQIGVELGLEILDLLLLEALAECCCTAPRPSAF